MLMILSILDILAGVCLGFGWQGTMISVIGLCVLVKGLFSLVGSLSQAYFFDWMGWVDLIAGIFLIFGMSVSFFWMLPILKGAYSLIFSFK